MAFRNIAREYHNAANELFGVSEVDRGSTLITGRCHRLGLAYFHPLELGLKASLCACGKPIERTSRRHHQLTKLYEECRTLGLVVDPDDKVGLGNIVSSLESGNEGHGFRYFRSGSVVTADRPAFHCRHRT